MIEARNTGLAGLALALVLIAPPAFAASTVNVTLNDDAAGTMSTDLGMGMGGDMSKASMHVTADVSEVPAGEVTFAVTNKSAGLVHEMLVVKADPNTMLPMDAASGGVDEDKAGSLGEVSELDPGKSGSLKLTLEPGSYVLFCNVPGHFASGMWTALTVK